jgi:hypothetical protein
MINYEQKLDYLEDIVEELTARGLSSDCVVPVLQKFSWLELCDEGIRIFTELYNAAKEVNNVTTA